ncbi:MAG: tetratricopeptide repeat protein [Rhodospirillales bacterium]|nr:tetratricopeptide repeat protein [Rhodospirillales bacterium]
MRVRAGREPDCCCNLGRRSCGPLQESGFLTGSFWESNPVMPGDETSMGLAQLARGNYSMADNYFQRALKNNPKDVHAMLGAGILYQNTGQTARSRAMYEAVLASQPRDTERFMALDGQPSRPIAEIARQNLAVIESGPEGLGGPPRAMPTQRPMTPGTAPFAQSSPMAMPPRPPGSMLAVPVTPVQAAGAPQLKFADGDANIVSRFTTLRVLRDQGLVAPDEFNARRQSNVGALLPLTSPPPASGLDRPVPTTEQIVGRLRAIARALEMRAITVAQHSSERAIILDGLMPIAPSVVANPASPPLNLLDAADAVRRLEMLREGGYVAPEEYEREKKSIEASIAPPPPPPIAKAPAPLAPAAGKEAQPKAKGPQAAVHIASFRSQKEAERGWAQLKRAHKELLGNLDSEISKIELGSKGTFYRLKAGPLPDKAMAADVCNKLKARRQFCDPAFMGE